jgi:AcrR family transcriptional regulator
MRGIAADAGVDVALMYHYFGSKEKLFIAAMALPVTPAAEIDRLVAEGPLDTLGDRLVRAVLEAWGEFGDGESPFVGLLRSATQHAEGARMVREFLRNQITAHIAVALPYPQPELRAALLASQMVGILVTRLVVRLEPISSAPVDALVACYGPTMQRYLTGELPVVPASDQHDQQGRDEQTAEV